MDNNSNIHYSQSALLSEELSGNTLAALQEFLLEQQKAEVESGGDPFAENWGKSQFWYDSSTASTLAEEVMSISQQGQLSIVCVACPSLFRELKTQHPAAKVHLLEYDRRFATFGEQFIFYDYNQPVDLPQTLAHTFDVVVADPPYLSEECLAKTAETMKFLAKHPDNSPMLLLTGAVQRERALKFLQLRPCKFRPQHSKKLGNEFMLFTNYPPSDRLGGWDIELDVTDST